MQNIHAQEINVSGFIIDGESLEDLSGVHVYLKKHVGTTSDIDGKFRFQVNHLDTLHFSRVGYDSLALVITDIKDRQNFFLSMKRSITVLDNVDIKALYQSNTILKKPSQRTYRVPGINYPEPYEEDYHMGLQALISPMTALYRLFSKRYKEEKKNYQILKARKIEDALFAKASENLSEVLEMTDIYIDDYFYRDFIQFSGLTTRFVAESTEYELILMLPQAMKQYAKHLEEQE